MTSYSTATLNLTGRVGGGGDPYEANEEEVIGHDKTKKKRVKRRAILISSGLRRM